MQEKKFKKRCEYAEQCPVFKGEKQVKNMPLYLFRNVFCNRGEKGWNNCDQFTQYKMQNLVNPQ